jgi:hypothetical protein
VSTGKKSDSKNDNVIGKTKQINKLHGNSSFSLNKNHFISKKINFTQKVNKVINRQKFDKKFLNGDGFIELE